MKNKALHIALKTCKIIGITLLSVILLIVLLAALLYFPPFQNWAAHKASAIASEKTGMEISIERVHLAFPLDLSLEGFRAIEPNYSVAGRKDTVANVRQLITSVRLMPLFDKQIEVDRLNFHDLSLNTTHFISDTRVEGHVGSLAVTCRGIDLIKQDVRVQKAILRDAKINVVLSDTAKKDTSKTETNWRIHVSKLNIVNTDVSVHMPGDTLAIGASIRQLAAAGGYFDLKNELYKVGQLRWWGGSLTYDNNFALHQLQGLDFNHIALSGINVGVDSLSYHSPDLRLRLAFCQVSEKQSGINITQLAGPVSMDSTKLILPALKFATPQSALSLNYAMDLNAFSNQQPGRLHALVDGRLAKRDLMAILAPYLPKDVRELWPQSPLIVKGAVSGNLRDMDIHSLALQFPGIIKLNVRGNVKNLADMDHLLADVHLKALTQNTSIIRRQLPASTLKTINIPDRIGLSGHFIANTLDRWLADFRATQGGGSIGGKARINLKGLLTYDAKLHATALPLQNFVRGYGLHPFTGTLALSGQGTDPASPRMRLKAKANVQRFRIDNIDCSHILADASIASGIVHAKVNANNPLLRGLITVDGPLLGRNISATVTADLQHADLYHLRLLDEPIAVALCGNLDIESDKKDYLKVQGLMSDVTVTDRNKVYRPDDVVLDIISSTDTTHAIVDCGDFHLNADMSGSYKGLITCGQSLAKELQRQIDNRYIDEMSFRQRLPLARIYLTSGRDNFFLKLLRRYGYEFSSVMMDMTSSPTAGLNGDLYVDSLIVDSMQLDTVRLSLSSDSTTMNYALQVRNGPKNPQYTFNALLDGQLIENGTSAHARIYDDHDRLGIDLGANAVMQQNGIRLNLLTPTAVLGYKEFNVNDSNYVFLADNQRISANMILKADDGQGIQIYSNDDNEEALQDITMSLAKFDLASVTAVLPYFPDITGIANGDFHVVQTAEDLSVSSSVSINNMTYQQCPMGDIGTDFVYMPKGDGTHYVDGFLTHNGDEVATLRGTYDPKGGGALDADIDFERTPMSIFNGFIPDQLIGFKGYVDGSLQAKGALSRLDVNGEILADSAYVFSVPYGIDMRVSNDPLTIKNSRIQFENFELFAHNDQPMDIYGYLDFSNTSDMRMDVKMRAQNFLLIDAPETYRSTTYGKAYVNFFGAMSGPVDQLSLKGRLDVLGSTNLTYVMRDTPLSTDNQMDDLVQFVDFSSSESQNVERPPLTGFSMAVSINVDETAHIVAALNSDKSNYVDIIGGGELLMRYNVADGVTLNGRYTLSSGEMKYSLPVIPLKTFTIANGSYIEFNGDPMNPRLNITATERTKADVSSGSSTRSVDFDCGVKISKTLANMGVEFIVDAPEDLSVSDELNQMTTEERGKVAVTMLTTGMYLSDGNTSKFSMNSALNAFLQSQIDKIAGSALRTMDLSFGVDNTTTATGSTQTDYSFKFAKRFWDNRLNIIIGGKLSTGPDVSKTDKTFFDNVTFEYRLDNNASKYLKLFYQRDSYDWLEGNTGVFGGGFIWRRKLRHFKDLFRFKDPEEQVVPMDSTKRKP